VSSQSIPSSSGSSTLGTPTQRYEGGGAVANMIAALVFILIGAGVAYAGLTTTPSRSSDDSNIGMMVVGGAFAVIGLFMVFNWWRTRGLSVQVYSDGLARIQGAKVEEVRWDNVNAVWQSITKHYRNGIYTGTTYLYTVETNDSRKLKFGNEVKGIEQLGQTIQNESTKRLFPKMVAAYNAGQPVAFGQFTLSKDGVGHKNKYLSWAEIEGTQINKGYVTFKKQGKWFNWANVPVAQIPNLIVFLSLIDHVVGLKSGR
jgi:hypothetical protein